jgi:ribosome-associated protein YbcJ (S4-like RNA binding protein)
LWVDRCIVKSLPNDGGMIKEFLNREKVQEDGARILRKKKFKT